MTLPGRSGCHIRDLTAREADQLVSMKVRMTTYLVPDGLHVGGEGVHKLGHGQHGPRLSDSTMVME